MYYFEPTDAECSCPPISLNFWSYEGWTYSARIGIDSGRYCFEGKMRVKNSRHTYFPRRDYSHISLGGLLECKEKLQKILLKYNCPSDTIKQIFTELKFE